MSAVRSARGPVKSYSELHRDSPIALAFDNAGPVNVGDNLRADIAHGVGRKDLARAYQLGIASASHGFAADVHQGITGLWPELSPADYLTRWISTGCSWHTSGGVASDLDAVNPDAADEYSAARVARLDQWAAELVQCAPVWYVDWLARLLHQPKWELLVEMGAQCWLGAPAPYDPQTDWSAKMGRQWVARHRSDAIVAAVTHELRDIEF